MARVRSFAIALVVALVLLPQLAAAPAVLAQDSSPVAGGSVWVGTEPDLAAIASPRSCHFTRSFIEG